MAQDTLLGFPAPPSLPSRRIYHFIDRLNSFYTSRFFWVFRSKRCSHSAVEGKGDGAADGKCGGAFQLRGGNDHNGVTRPQALTWRWTALPIISLTSTVPRIMEPSLPLRIRVLRPDAQRDGAGCRAVGLQLGLLSSGQGHLGAVQHHGILPSVLQHQLGVVEVHLRHADEAGHKQVLRVVKDLLRRADLLDDAVFMMTIRSPRVMASVWSWVT